MPIVSLPKFAKMWETPASVRASSSAMLAVCIEQVQTFRCASGEGIGDLLEQSQEFGLLRADDLVELPIVIDGVCQKPLEHGLAGTG
jgi:hypothetical protein